MPVIVQERASAASWIGRSREWMTDLGRSVFGEDAGGRRREIRSAVVAGNAVLLVLSAKQPRRPLRIVRRMARDARVLRYGGVTSYVRLRSNFILHEGVGASPNSRGGSLCRPFAGWVVTGQAHLAARTVADQEILRDQILCLHMGVMTRRALNIAIDQANRPGRIAGYSF